MSKLLVFISVIIICCNFAICDSKPYATNNTNIASDTLALYIIDSNGKPIEGAKVGSLADWSDTRPAPERARVRFAKNWSAVLSQNNGIAILKDDQLFEDMVGQVSVPLYVLHESKKIGALTQVSRADIGQTVRLQLQPLCHIEVHVNSEKVQILGQEPNMTFASIKWKDFNPFRCESNKGIFNFYLPPGQYVLLVYGEKTQFVYREIEIQNGQKNCELQIDLPVNRWVSLLGRAAPEFQNIKGWIGKSATMQDLRGKVVLLDFWGYWCTPCINQMPKLMQLYDKFKEQGLEVIAIHSDSISSIEELNEKLEIISKRNWDNKMPPRIALDGGGKISIAGTNSYFYGTTTATYGITTFPTTLLIDRQGMLVQKFDPENTKDVASLECLLSGKTVGTAEFDRVYSLDKNQALKRIAPRVIKLREGMFNELSTDKYPYASFQWAEKLYATKGGHFFTKVTLKDILEKIVGLSKFDYCCSEQLLALEIPGDWIIRKDAPKENIFRDLEKIISEYSGQAVHFEKRQVVHDVIVANGVFEFKPLSGTFNDTGIHIFSDKLDPDERGGGGQGSLDNFLTQLSSVALNKQVVNQVKQADDITISWFWHLSCYIKKLPEGQDKVTKLHILLDNLSKQLSLTFSQEQRNVDVWYVTQK